MSNTSRLASVTPDAATQISTLAAIAAALVAVALALLVVVPSVSAQARAASGTFTGRHIGHVLRASFSLLVAAVMLLVAGATLGIVGLFWPSQAIAYVVGALTACGIVALSGGAGVFAFVTLTALLKR